jgi:hypothetical protein
MNIVFLDIDGVLNHGVGTGLHPDKVKLLNPLAEHANFVLSSNWRMTVSLPQMAILLRHRGFIGQLVGRTAILEKEARGKEIRAFLDEHGNKINSYVVLDDLSNHMDKEMLSKLVQTEEKVGLTEAHVQRAINILLNGTEA